MVRLLLAATLSPNYGIYGPAFELMEHVPREPGSEEYLDSEKYEVRAWNLERPDSLAPFIGHVNRIRRRLPALRASRELRFHAVDNDQVIAFSKLAPGDPGNPVLVVVNLDPHHVQSGWLDLDLAAPGLEPGAAIDAVDHLVDATYRWEMGRPQFVRLDPAASPGHVFELAAAGAVARP
jgi:starch synthase (maltosyl-transferring)